MSEVGQMRVVPWTMRGLWVKVWNSFEEQRSEAHWDVVRQRHFPSREQVSRLASNHREEARQSARGRQGEPDGGLGKLAPHSLQRPGFRHERCISW